MDHTLKDEARMTYSPFLFAAGNPFIHSYLQSDGFGKLIFLALLTLSITSWIVLAHKLWMTYQVGHLSRSFASLVAAHKHELLTLQFIRPKKEGLPHPFFEIYKTFKQHTLQRIEKSPSSKQEALPLSAEDFERVADQMYLEIAAQTKILDKHLFILPTAIALAPFLGLLGTVWGILLTFSGLEAQAVALNNTAMLAGLSLALTTTIIGLVVAIPALIGYNYLRNANREYRRDMEQFSRQLLSVIETQFGA